MRSGSSEFHFRSLRLPGRLREKLSVPLGPTYSGDEVGRALASVPMFAACGDMVSRDAWAMKRPAFLAIVDGKTERSQAMPTNELEAAYAGRVERTKNPPGMLSEDLQEVIHRRIRNGGGLIVVDGEEDLAVLPLLGEMPLGTLVIYGQPRRGVCMIKVSEQTKRFAKDIMSQMEVA